MVKANSCKRFRQAFFQFSDSKALQHLDGTRTTLQTARAKHQTFYKHLLNFRFSIFVFHIEKLQNLSND